MKITVVGTGYVGLVTGTCLAEVGHTVTCIDVDQSKVTKLNQCESPIYEPGIEKLMGRNMGHERLFFSCDIRESLNDSEVVFIAVGTPEGDDGSADLSYVMTVAREIGKLADRDLLVIVKSTVPVGTGDMVDEAIAQELEKREKHLTITVASNPEFLKEGAAVDDFMKPERIVVGLKGAAQKSTSERKLFGELYEPFITDDPARLMIMDRRASELTKYGSNAMLATRISFMNEFARLCDKVGANIDDIRRGMGADSRIGKKFLYAGPGYGGSCFPKDVEALVKTGQQYDSPMTVLAAVQAANLGQKEYAASKVVRYFGTTIKSKTVAIWGLSFKPGTDDVRETPAATIIKALLDSGAAVVAHDPQARPSFERLFGTHNRLSYADDAYQALEGADAFVLVTEWSEYKSPNWIKVERMMRSKVIFDFRNQYSFERLSECGFHYESIGRVDSITRTLNS